MKQTAHGWKNIEIGPSRRFRARSVLIEHWGGLLRSGLVPSGPLIRAGRCLLGLEVADLARLAAVPADAVRRAECGGATRMRRRIVKVLAIYGVLFAEGSVLRRPTLAAMRAMDRCRQTRLRSTIRQVL